MPLTLSEVLLANKSLKTSHPKNLIGVFVGATSGIGEHTFRAFVKHTNSPRAFLIGRNAENADRIVREAKESNPDATIEWVKADVSLLSEVRRVCGEIEKGRGDEGRKVDLLVLTPSFTSLRGREESPEGLDRKLTLIYHSRLLFHYLLRPSRTISVLTPGHEIPIDLSNLTVRKNYNANKALSYATTMTSLSFHYLAGQEEEKGTKFLHVNPGIVKTGVMRGMSWWMRAAMEAGFAVTTPWRLGVEETGERVLEIGFAERYAESGSIESNIGPDAAAAGAKGILGRKGVYSLWKNGEETGRMDVLEKLVADEYDRKVWEHTLEVFRQVEENGRYEGAE